MKGRAKSSRRVKSRKLESDVVHFYKVSGAGNHFVLLDARNGHPGLTKRGLARALCVHGHSIGADGVLFIERSSVTDFKLVYYNADGGEAPMCGNGARCAAVFAFEKGIAGNMMRFETGCGIVEAKARPGGAEVNMGRPRGLRKRLVVSASVGRLEGSVVDTGVPHFVTIVRDVERLAVGSLGRELRFHRIFRPKGANIDFVQVNRDGSVVIRTYERGVEGETLACGTGAVAAAACLGALGLVRSPVRILTRGGDVLRVRYMDKSNPLSAMLLDGPAQVIYKGNIPVKVLRRVLRRFQSGG